MTQVERKVKRMSAIPLADAPAFAPAARRTLIVRVVLAATLIAAVVAAVLVSRNPHTQTIVALPSDSTAIVVLDLSASISADTYSRIGATLSSLARSHGRYGLVVFSDQAYEALPPGTAAANLEPLVRYFRLPKQTTPGFAPTYPTNPWTDKFSAGTKISAGLELAHTIAVDNGVRRPVVILISDLDDDPDDVARLATIMLAYKRDHIPLRIVGLNPSPEDRGVLPALCPAGGADRAGGHARRRGRSRGTTRRFRGRSSRSPPPRRPGSRRTSCGARASNGSPREERCAFAGALVLVVLAVVAALLAADVRGWQRTLQRRRTPRGEPIRPRRRAFRGTSPDGCSASVTTCGPGAQSGSTSKRFPRGRGSTTHWA